MAVIVTQTEEYVYAVMLRLQTKEHYSVGST